MATSLDTPIDTNVANVLSVLSGQGYTWAPLTESFNSYLARALTGIGGSTVSHLTMSREQLLAGLVNALGSGPVSHLTTGMPGLLNSLGAAGSAPGGSSAALKFNLASNSQYISLLEDI